MTLSRGATLIAFVCGVDPSTYRVTIPVNSSSVGFATIASPPWSAPS
jgi:hypothetical protein